MLQTGTSFPEFSLPDQNGVLRTLAEFAGKWLVVYCYPKDNTSGCTLEAQNFAALFASFEESGAAILGVSADTAKSHCHFAARLALPFFLLSDPEHRLLDALGVWQKKKMAGREYMGTVRSTFLIDPSGVVRETWTKVKVPGHAQAVRDSLHALKTASASAAKE